MDCSYGFSVLMFTKINIDAAKSSIDGLIVIVKLSLAFAPFVWTMSTDFMILDDKMWC